MICCTLLALLALVYLISDIVYRRGFEELERQTVEKNVTQVTEALSVSLDALDTLCYDWAEWDDTYKFAQDYNQEYVDRNLQDDTFASSKISLITVLNSSGEMVYKKAYDLVNSEEITLPDDFANTLIVEGLSTPASTGNTVAGIMLLTGQPMLVVSQPVLTSLGEGPSAGAIIFGRFLDSEVISALSETTHLSVNLLPISTEVNNIIESLNESGPMFIQAQSSNMIAGYTYVNGLEGNPAFIFEVVIPRDIYHQGTKVITLLRSLLLFIGITFCIVFVLLIKKLILSRLITLSKSVGNIGSSGDISRRVTVPGNDELSGLAKNINEMLASVENADKALQESEEKFSKAFRASPDAISISKLSDGTFLEINDSYSHIMGYSREELVGQNADKYNMWADAEQRENMLHKTREHIKIHNEEMDFRAKSGEINTLLVSTEYVHIGGELCLLVVSTDITERKKMEEALAIEATRRLILVEQSSDGIVILDQDGKVYEANRRFAEMLGYSPEEILKLQVWDWEYLFSPEKLKEMISTVGEAGDHFKTSHRRKDGTVYDVEISTNGAMFAGQKLIFCVCRDISERTRMEKALRESEEKFSLAFHSSPTAVAITTCKEGKFIEVNDSFADTMGYTPKELIGRTATELNIWVKPQARDRMFQILKDQGRVNNEEIGFRRKSGNTGTWLFSAEQINIAGEPCIIGVSIDITDRKKAEEALREREKRFSDIAGNAMEWIWEVDTKGKYTYSSPVVEKILGYKQEEILEKHFYDFFLPEEREELKKAAFEAFAQKQPIKEFVNRNRCKNGKTVELMTSGVPIINEEGNLLGYRGVDTDITERKRAEEQLRLLSSITQQVSDSTTIFSLDSKIKYMNQAAQNLFGYPLEDVRGKELDILNAVPVPESVVKEISQTVSSGRRWVGITQKRRKDGSSFMCECNISPLYDEKGQISSYIDVQHDVTEHLRIEEALRFSDAAFKSIHESVIAVDTENTITHWNEMSEQLFGIKAFEAIGKKFSDVIEMVESNIGDFKKISEILETDGHIQDERLYRTQKGHVWADVHTQDIVGNGKRYGRVILASDITQRKKAEEALRESEEKFSKAFHASPLMITITNRREGKFIDVNDSFVLTTGYSREDFIGHAGNDKNIWVKPEELKRMARLMQEQGKIRNEEYTLRMKSGEIRKWLCSADIITIGGEPCSIAVAADITDRKKAEAALRESEEKFSIAFHSSPATIAITTLKDGRYIDVNDSYINAMGYTSKELVGRTATDVDTWVRPEDRARLFKVLKEHGRVSNEEFDFRMKSGEIRTWLFSAEKIDIAGEPCLIGVSVDITERKKAEEKLKEVLVNLERSGEKLAATNKELEAFSYSVSHDLRSPLRSIDGFSQALLEDYQEKLDEKGQDYLRRLRGASQKMGELIDAILKLSRLTRSEMRHEPINLSALAKEIANRLQETQPERKVKFVIDKELTANGDPQLLRVLLENLLGNAWKFTKKQPQAEIEFSMEQNNGKKAYFIRDNGAGFDMTYADKLFNAFQRLHDASEFPGTGIGLATVQRIIHRHGGAIWAEGAVGKGANFHFTLD
jgi:PAS domain S-box-containing protein